MKPSIIVLAFVLFANVQFASAGDTLYPNTTLYMNQYIESGSRNFRLVMQSVGNLVMYRKDGTPRWSTGARGYNSIMQWDGNFVLYSTSRTSQWNTATDHNPGARLVVQDDGNLVIYAQNNRALWNIGTDTENDPQHIGDTVGRDLDIPGLGWAGHIGVWDGKQVAEAVNGSFMSNAIRFQSLNQFKSASQYWGYVAPNIPDELLSSACYQPNCNYNSDFESLKARAAIAKVAVQNYLIGADYTTTASYTPAQWGDKKYGAKRGKYRCDTFVLWLYLSASQYVKPNNATRIWDNRINELLNVVRTPINIFNKLRTYQ